MTLTFYRDYMELLSTCNGYWDLRNNVLPIIGSVSGTITEASTTIDRFVLSNRSYLFDGINDKITMGDTGVTIKSLMLWTKLNSTTQSILKLTDTPHTITVSSGTIAANNWPATVIIYVDGVLSSTISDTEWHCMIITTSGTAFSVSNLILGYDGTSYLAGKIGEILIFSDQIDAVKIKELYSLTNKKPLYSVLPGRRSVE